jgi:hypothetical protein
MPEVYGMRLDDPVSCVTRNALLLDIEDATYVMPAGTRIIIQQDPEFPGFATMRDAEDAKALLTEFLEAQSDGH